MDGNNKSNATGNNNRPLIQIRENEEIDPVPSSPYPMERRRRSTLTECDIKGISGDRLQVLAGGPPQQRRLSQAVNMPSGNNLLSTSSSRKETTALRRMSLMTTSTTAAAASSSSLSSSLTPTSALIGLEIDKTSVDHSIQERKLQQEIVKLQQSKLTLEEEVNEKSNELKEIISQNEQSQILVDRYKELYEAEVRAHLQTKEQLTEFETQLLQKIHEYTKLQEEMELTIKTLTKKYKDKKKQLKAEKKTEIDLRDNKIKKLKEQMSEAFKGSSWERQQQLEELQKELQKMHEESDTLRLKLRQSLKKGQCQNCAEKDKNIAELTKTLNAIGSNGRLNSGTTRTNNNNSITETKVIDIASLLSKPLDETTTNTPAKLPDIPPSKTRLTTNSKTHQ